MLKDPTLQPERRHALIQERLGWAITNPAFIELQRRDASLAMKVLRDISEEGSLSKVDPIAAVQQRLQAKREAAERDLKQAEEELNETVKSLAEERAKEEEEQKKLAEEGKQAESQLTPSIQAPDMPNPTNVEVVDGLPLSPSPSPEVARVLPQPTSPVQPLSPVPRKLLLQVDPCPAKSGSYCERIEAILARAWTELSPTARMLFREAGSFTITVRLEIAPNSKIQGLKIVSSGGADLDRVALGFLSGIPLPPAPQPLGETIFPLEIRISSER